VTRTTLITGATGALGSVVTRRFLADGHRVAATWAHERGRDSLLDQLGSAAEQPLLVQADVTDPRSVESLVREVEERLGSIEVLIHLVGGYEGGELVHQSSVERWDRMLELNLKSAFLCCRAALGSMLPGGWGRIVLVSSRAARSGRSKQAAYAVAKAGVSVLAEAIAEETRGTAVTANVVSPSVIDTPANRAAMPRADAASWVPAADIAAAIAFLASEEAGQLRGAWLPVFGSA
jgi:NAD(P)-dependent dehydrogenase (short-subunit alcohol dehydrogenase family)